MASNLSQGPSSGSQALNSMISQLRLRVKTSEGVISSNRKQISALEDENASLKKKVALLEKQVNQYANERVRYKDSALIPKAMVIHPGKSHSKLSQASSSTDATVNSGTGYSSGKSKEAAFCADILENKLSNNLDVKQKLQELISAIGEKLSQLGDIQVRESDIKMQVENWQATVRHLLQFFDFLQIVVINDGRDSTALSWLDVVLEKERNGSIRRDLAQIWRLLQWNIHMSLGKSRRHSPNSQRQIDEWFNKHAETQAIPENLEVAITNLLKTISRDFGIVEESVFEGLPMSVLTDPEGESSGVSSSDSSISSTIPPEDLWTFKSIFQTLVEKIDELMPKSAIISGFDEMERDMYLPQREALENYDLGNLLRLMSSVIHSLSQELVSIDAERGQGQKYGQNIGTGVKEQRKNDASKLNETNQVQQIGFGLGGVLSGLESKDSTAHGTGGHFQALPVLRNMKHGATTNIPLIKGPTQGTFQGIHGPLPPRQLSVQQNSPHTTSKSDSSLPPQSRKLVDHSLISKPSSLDSPTKPKSSSYYNNTSQSPVIYSHHLGEDPLSDSDEDFQVRGPPDTPPEIRTMERMPISKNITEHPAESSQILDKLGAFSKYAMQSASQPRDSGALNDRHIAYSQVQQCTGDNSGTTQDMLLPSSVQWSTVQLKDGGMASPTLEDMSRYATARPRSQHLNYFSPLPKDSLTYDYQDDVERDGQDTLTYRYMESEASKGVRPPCPMCHMTFPDYLTDDAIQRHIELHFDENAHSFEVINDDFNTR